MTTDPTNTSSGMPSVPELKEQSNKGLREFFQQKSIRNLVNVLVPSALAAILFPIFGPAVAGGAAAVAIQNGLKLLGISLSADTIGKVLKPLEGRQIDESDVQAMCRSCCKTCFPKISRSTTKPQKPSLPSPLKSRKLP